MHGGLSRRAGSPLLTILGLSTGSMAKSVLVILTVRLSSPQGKKTRWQKEEEDAEPVGWQGFRGGYRENFW